MPPRTRPIVGTVILCDNVKWKYTKRRIDLVGVLAGPLKAKKLPAPTPRFVYFTYSGTPVKTNYRLELNFMGKDGWELLAWWTGDIEILDRTGSAIFVNDLWVNPSTGKKEPEPVLLEEHGTYSFEVSLGGERVGETTFELSPK
jgi:hypothetical protein